MNGLLDNVYGREMCCFLRHLLENGKGGMNDIQANHFQILEHEQRLVASVALNKLSSLVRGAPTLQDLHDYLAEAEVKVFGPYQQGVDTLLYTQLRQSCTSGELLFARATALLSGGVSQDGYVDSTELMKKLNTLRVQIEQLKLEPQMEQPKASFERATLLGLSESKADQLQKQIQSLKQVLYAIEDLCKYERNGYARCCVSLIHEQLEILEREHGLQLPLSKGWSQEKEFLIEDGPQLFQRAKALLQEIADLAGSSEKNPLVQIRQSADYMRLQLQALGKSVGAEFQPEGQFLDVPLQVVEQSVGSGSEHTTTTTTTQPSSPLPRTPGPDDEMDSDAPPPPSRIPVPSRASLPAAPPPPSRKPQTTTTTTTPLPPTRASLSATPPPPPKKSQVPPPRPSFRPPAPRPPETPAEPLQPLRPSNLAPQFKKCIVEAKHIGQLVSCKKKLEELCEQMDKINQVEVEQLLKKLSEQQTHEVNPLEIEQLQCEVRALFTYASLLYKWLDRFIPSDEVNDREMRLHKSDWDYLSQFNEEKMSAVQQQISKEFFGNEKRMDALPIYDYVEIGNDDDFSIMVSVEELKKETGAAVAKTFSLLEKEFFSFLIPSHQQ